MINLGLNIFQFLNAEKQINFVHIRPFYPVPEGLWSNQAAPEKKKQKNHLQHISTFKTWLALLLANKS